MLKINFKDGSVLLITPRMHTVYPRAGGALGEPLLVAHFDNGPPEYVPLRAVESIVDFPQINTLRSSDFWPL